MLDMPTLFKRDFVTAKKDHKCTECWKPIFKGEDYTYIWGIWNSKPETYKVCGPCQWVRDVLDLRCDEDAFGDLWQNVVDSGFNLTPEIVRSELKNPTGTNEEFNKFKPIEDPAP